MLEVQDARRNLVPPEQPISLNPTLACDKFAAFRDDDRMQKSELFDAFGQAGDVAEFAARALADMNRRERR